MGEGFPSEAIPIGIVKRGIGQVADRRELVLPLLIVFHGGHVFTQQMANTSSRFHLMESVVLPHVG
ncbi:MAG: hypothetical protein M0008_05265 [Actinomycetota bacterium]|nr:hypothetical protein [Actinomycetota bacterium]